MLSLQRYKGEKVYIGDEELVILDFNRAFLYFRYQGDFHSLTISSDVNPYYYNPSPNVTIRYTRLKRNQARFQISSPLPIYRGEIYEQRNSKRIT
jgi:sRNA-binding carbon storage regulator CsrA